MDHLVGEGQPDAVDPDLPEARDDLGHRGAVEAERDAVGVLARVVVGVVVRAAAAVPGAAGAVPVAGAQLEAVAVRVDDVRGVAGFVLPEDRVDVILTRGEGENKEEVADILLQNVKVLAVDQMAGDKGDKPVVVRAVTLELSPQEAQKVILAQGVGKISLILNRAGNQQEVQTTRVTVSDLSPAEKAVAPAETAVVVAPPVPDNNRVVNVVRDGNKREQYSVVPEKAATRNQ